MDQYEYRHIEDFPGIGAFKQAIKDYTIQINNYLQVDADICSYGDYSQQSNTLAKVIGELMEAKFNWSEIIPNKAPPTREEYPEPHLRQDRFAHLRADLDSVRGMDTSIEPGSFNFNVDKTTGGFDI